ncbi:kinase-like protein [Paxillus ammoniavirescens]|nr:kinase-like protein [Paxillus ammoniavirescens]
MAEKEKNRRCSNITLPSVIANRYKLIKMIGQGGVADVYEGIDQETSTPVAIKITVVLGLPFLRQEFRVLDGLKGTVGVPRALHLEHAEVQGYTALVIELCGPTLDHLRERCGGKFTIKTVCLIARQMITRLRSIHDKCYVLNWLMPASLLLGPPGADLETKNLIHFVGFGIAKQFSDDTSDSGANAKQQICEREQKGFSRKEDLLRLGYVLAYFLQGGSWESVIELVIRTRGSVSDIFAKSPAQFATYMTYVDDLDYMVTPDYGYLRRLFDEVLEASSECDDGVYDWMLLDTSEGNVDITKEDRPPSNSPLHAKEKCEASGREQVKNTKNGAWYKSVWERVKRTRAPNESLPDDHNVSQPKKHNEQVELTEVVDTRGKQRNLARPKGPLSPTGDGDSEADIEGRQGGPARQSGQGGRGGRGGIGQGGRGCTLTVDEEPVPLNDVCCFCLCFLRNTRKSPVKRS